MSDLKNKSGGLEPGEAFSKPVYYVIAGVYALLAVTGISLNTLVIVAFVRDRSLRTSSNRLILSIATGDWLHSLLAYPLGIVSASQTWRMHGVSCTWYAFITCFLSYGIILHHAAFSIERAITINYCQAWIAIKGKLNFVIGGLWIFALIWSLCPLFGWSAYVPEGGGVFCSIRWQSSDLLDMVFVGCLFFFFFFIPIVTMVSAYSSIYHSMKKLTQNAHVIWGKLAAPTVEAIQAEKKTARMAFIMSICFVFAWTPYAVVSLYIFIATPQNLSPFVATIPSLFAKTSACYNPIVYFLLYKKFRDSLGQTLRSLCCQDSGTVDHV